MSNSDIVVSTLHKHLTAHRLSVVDEETLQKEIEGAFKLACVPFEREARLSPDDRPDFMVHSTVVEVKISHESAAIHRQLLRYSAHPGVTSLVLVSLRPVVGLPPTMHGKPVRQFAVWPYCV